MKRVAPLPVVSNENIAECFSESYAEAREKFLQSTATAVVRKSLPLMGDNGVQLKGVNQEPLFIDIAIYGNVDNAKRVFLHTSGVHGAEGYAGGAIQTFIAKSFDFNSISSDDAVVLIHAVNPFGMSYMRRFNENNVDLNRNFHYPNDPQFYSSRGTPTLYRKLFSFFNPKKPFPFFDFFFFVLTGLGRLVRHGYTALKLAVVDGQYDFPKGIYWMGNKLENGPKSLLEYLKDWMTPNANLRFVYLVDVHTGLGRKGEDSLWIDATEAQGHTQMAAYPGALAMCTVGGADVAKKSIAYDVRGGTNEGIQTMVATLPQGANVKVQSVTQEFGTRHPFFVLWACRKENIHWQYPTTVGPPPKRDEARRAFYLKDDQKWKQSILARGLTVFKQTLDYIAIQ